MQYEMLEKINQAEIKRQPVVMITCLDDHEQYLFSEDKCFTSSELSDELLSIAKESLSNDHSQTLDTEEGKYFFLVLNTPIKLLIVGAVHISQILAPLATMCGYDVTVIDPRQAFATNDRFPNIKLNTAWPDEALEELKPDSRTAIVVLTHDPKLDDPALISALNSNAFYIGALGSKKTQASRQQRMSQKEFSLEQQQRICGPVGLNIGAKTPAEIALSIMAQITEKRYLH